MKKTTLLILLLLATTFVFAQHRIFLEGKVSRGIVGYSKGDTVTIYAVRTNPNSGKEQYVIRNSGEREFMNVNADRITLLDSNLDFWDHVWLNHRAEDILKLGWETEKRQELQEDASDYFSQAVVNRMIFKDDLLYDYLYRLIYHIHPTPLFKDRATNFSVVILNSIEPMSFAFDNGMLVLTAGLIAQTASEEALINVLTEAITHSVLEHNLVNLNRALRAERNARIWGTITGIAAATAMAIDQVQTGNYYDYGAAADFGLASYFLSAHILQNIGAKYSLQQNNNAKVIAANFTKAHPYIKTLSRAEFIGITANAITYTAWQEHHLKNYAYARELAEKLESLDLATAKDYLLLSRIQRKLMDDEEANQKALSYLERAREKSIEIIPELEKESGLLYARLNQHEQAKVAFLNYKEQLLLQKAEGGNVEDDLLYVNQLIQRRGYAKKPATELDSSIK